MLLNGYVHYERIEEEVGEDSEGVERGDGQPQRH